MTTHHACTLSGPEFVRRIQAWRQVTARAHARALTDDALVSTYPAEPALVAELKRLIEAEKECCSFMEFQIDETPEDVVVRLRVPDEMRSVLALMSDLTASGSATAAP